MKHSKKLLLFFTLIVCTLSFIACKNDKPVIGSKYVQGKDDQPYFDGMHNVIGTKDGYYLLENEKISYYDKKASKIHVLCGKAECNHDNEECNAYTFTGAIRFYNDKLYCIEPDENDVGDYNFYEMSKDGSSKNALFVLFHQEGTEVEQIYINDFIVHRGYVYYCITNFNVQPSIYQIARRKVEKNAKEEIVQEFEFENTLEFEGFQGVGDYIYYSVVKKDDTKKYSQLYTYNIQNYSTECIFDKETSFKDFIVEENKIYYTDSDSLYVKNREDGKIEKVMELPEKECFEISLDEEYFYFDNYNRISLEFLNSGKTMEEYENPKTFKNRKVYIYDKESKKQVTILDIANSDTFYSGDENLVLVGDEVTERCGTMSILSKKTIGTDSQEWKKVQ